VVGKKPAALRGDLVKVRCDWRAEGHGRFSSNFIGPGERVPTRYGSRRFWETGTQWGVIGCSHSI